MGLMLHSLNELPQDAERSYYIYLLDYGWHEPLGDVIMQNFMKISEKASKNKAVFIKGIDSSHVDNEILSWHHVNGEDGEKILPAIMITNMNPHKFKVLDDKGIIENKDKIILIPLKNYCKNTTDVINLIQKIFEDIEEKKELTDFKVKNIMKKGIGKKLLDGVILQPNFIGVGFDLKAFLNKKET